VAALDGCLPEKETQGLLQHLSVCPNCAAFKAQQSRLDRLFRGAAAAPVEPPERLWQNIASRIEAQNTRRESFFPKGLLDLLRIPQWGYALGAALILLFTGLVSVETRSIDPAQAEILAHLDAFDLDTGGNPFDTVGDQRNPFFSMEAAESGNPFAGIRRPVE